MQTSVFSEHLAALLKHSLKLDADTGTGEDFIELQKLEARIIDAQQTGHYTGKAARALSSIAAELHKDYRTALKLDPDKGATECFLTHKKCRAQDAGFWDDGDSCPIGKYKNSNRQEGQQICIDDTCRYYGNKRAAALMKIYGEDDFYNGKQRLF